MIISCNNKKGILEKFGTGQNAGRKALHLAPVEKNIKPKEDVAVEGRRYIFIHKDEVDIIKPEYLRKIILLDPDKEHISVEQDYFKNPIEGKYLIVEHTYSQNQTSIRLSEITPNIQMNTSIELSLAQADSVLEFWKIDINPFK